MKQAIAKERQRAEEAAQQHGNAKRFEERSGWAKGKQPERYAALLEANRKVAEMWAGLVRQTESATHPDALAGAKHAANAATAEKLQLENRSLSKSLQEAYKKTRSDHKEEERPREPKSRTPQID